MNTLRCPHCGGEFDGGEDPPLVVECAHCHKPTFSHLKPRTPGTVPPSDQQIVDHQGDRVTLNSMIIVVAIGFFLLLYYFVTNSTERLLLVCAMFMILGGGILAAIITAHRPMRSSGSIQADVEVPEEPPAFAPTSVLEYARPLPSGNRHRGASLIAHAAIGVIIGFASILACARMRVPVLLLGIPIVGVALLFIRGVRGLGIGMLIAIPLAMLIIIGLCAGLR